MSHTRTALLAATLSVTLSVTLLPGVANGAGFGLIQHSAKSGGTAFAGTAATPTDPATVFFNPAGMVYNEDSAIAVAGHLLAPTFDFDDQATTNALGLPMEGRQSSEGGSTTFVPNFYYMQRLPHRWSFGLAANAPFGSRTNYHDDWVGRYESVKSEIGAININANVAYQINGRVSVGFGLNAQYFEAELSSKIPNTDPDAGAIFSPETDSSADIDGDSWGVGWNLGVLAELAKGTQLGIAWRSKVRHDLSGDYAISDPAGNVVAQGRASATVDLPESLTVSLRHSPAFEERLALLADVAFTRWNRVRTVEIEGPPGDQELALGFSDSFRFALGGTWDQTERLQFRAGLAFDQSAVSDKEVRSPRVPDNNRRWVSLGAGYIFANGLEIDGSYSHLFISDTPIDREAEWGQLTGVYDSNADIVNAQLTYRFNL